MCHARSDLRRVRARPSFTHMLQRLAACVPRLSDHRRFAAANVTTHAGDSESPACSAQRPCRAHDLSETLTLLRGRFAPGLRRTQLCATPVVRLPAVRVRNATQARTRASGVFRLGRTWSTTSTIRLPLKEASSAEREAACALFGPALQARSEAFSRPPSAGIVASARRLPCSVKLRPVSVKRHAASRAQWACRRLSDNVQRHGSVTASQWARLSRQGPTASAMQRCIAAAVP